MKKIVMISIVLYACIGTMAQTDRFCIASKDQTASIIVDENDWKGVIRTANDLGDDVRKVSGAGAKVLYQGGKLIMIDPEIVVEQIVVNPDNNRYSYFGNIK